MDFVSVTATENDWVNFFGNDRNMSHDFTDKRNFKSTPCLRAFQQIADSNLSKKDRAQILEKIVKVLLNKWGKLTHLEGINAVFRGLRHPIRDILVLTRIGGVPDSALIELTTLQFWEKLPPEENRSLLMRAFGKHSPIESEELEILFHDDIEQYGRTVLSILLERGLIAQADSLFRTRMSELYGDVDPGSLDWLVEKGLPVATANLWLEKSVNRKNADRGDKVAIGHCDEAIVRWAKLAPAKTAPP